MTDLVNARDVIDDAHHRPLYNVQFTTRDRLESLVNAVTIQLLHLAQNNFRFESRDSPPRKRRGGESWQKFSWPPKLTSKRILTRKSSFFLFIHALSTCSNVTITARAIIKSMNGSSNAGKLEPVLTQLSISLSTTKII